MILRGNLFSECLKTETPVSILIPNPVPEDGAYRVCYLLHPLESSGGSWLDKTLLPLWAEQGDTIFVMPDGQRSFFLDMKYGERYFSYIAEELPERIETLFHISAQRKDTAIAGASMGAYAALRAALKCPGRFGFCGAIAPALLYASSFLCYQREDKGWHYDIFTAALGERMPWTADLELTELSKVCPGPKPRIYLSVGTEDPAKRPSVRFCETLTELDYDIRRECWEGEHDWAFFGTALEKTMQAFA